MTYKWKNRCRPSEIVISTKNHKNKGYKKGLSLIIKKGIRQNYVIQKKNIKTKNKNTRCAKQRENGF
jgi:hypothetical protein